MISRKLCKSVAVVLLCALLAITTACSDNSSQSTSSKQASSGNVGAQASDNSQASETDIASSSAAQTQGNSSIQAASTSSNSQATSSKTGTSSKPTSTSSKQSTQSVQSVKPSEVSQAPAVQRPENITPAVTGLTPIKSTAFYGRAALAKQSNSAALIAAYDRIVDGVENCVENINLNDAKYTLSESELKLVISYYKSDYPHHFWLSNSYRYQTTSSGKKSKVVGVSFDYTMTGSALSKAKTDFDNAVKAVLSGISGSSSAYEREKAIHDRLTARVKYVDGKHAHTAYGALVLGNAVCEGYAKAFQYLCYQAGIQTLFVTGDSYNPSTNVRESHAWNIVKLGSAYYHVDVTWDDQENDIFYAYFNLTDAQIRQDHVVDNGNYPLPSCNSTAENYFAKCGGIVSSPYSVQTVGALLKAGNLKARVYVNGNVNSFINWYMNTDNIKKIAAQAGVSGGFSYGYSAIGNEVICTITK